MSNYALLTRIVRVTEDSIFLEALEIEEGIPLHISVRLSRMDTDDGEEFYQRPEDPLEMARTYHDDFGMLVVRSTWNAATKKCEWMESLPSRTA